jgi:2-dehydro-3-deoxygluconokinase
MGNAEVDLVSLGEVMLRLSPPRYQRLRNTHNLNVHPCGAQFNVAANLAQLGKKSLFLSRLPDNELGYLARDLGESLGVDMLNVKFVDVPKLGLVFVEFGASPRRAVHLYDRSGSAASTMVPEDYDWDELLKQARYAYLDGIFPAISDSCYRTALKYLEAARGAGTKVCFDVNFRESLWARSDTRAGLARMLEHVDILVTNRTISESLFGYTGNDRELMAAYHAEFGCSLVCLTYKEMYNAESGSWRSLAVDSRQQYESRNFDFQAVDPFGTGDAFVAGLLYGLLESYDITLALNFGGALCALSHTVEGDQAVFSAGEVEALLGEDYSFITKR